MASIQNLRSTSNTAPSSLLAGQFAITNDGKLYYGKPSDASVQQFVPTLTNPVQRVLPCNFTADQSSNNMVYYCKFIAEYNMTVTSMGVFVSAGNGDDTFYCGLYSSGGSLLTSGSLVPSTAGYQTMSVTSQAIVGGTEYWAAFKGVDASASAGGFTVLSNANAFQSEYYGSTGLPSSISASATNVAVYMDLRG